MHETRAPQPGEEGDKDELLGSLPNYPGQEPQEPTPDPAPDGAEEPRFTRRQWLLSGLGLAVAGGAGALLWRGMSELALREETRRSAMRLLGAGLRGDDLAPMIDGMSPRLRQLVSDDMRTVLQDTPPADPAPLRVWQLHARILSKLDPASYEADFKERSQAYFRSSLSGLDSYTRAPDPLRGLDLALRETYLNMKFVPDDSRLIGAGRIQSAESELLGRHSARISSYVERVLQQVCESELGRTERAGEALNRGTLGWPRIRSEMERSGLFSQEGGRYLFTQQAAGGEESVWRVDFTSPLNPGVVVLRDRDLPQRMVAVYTPEFLQCVNEKRVGELIGRAERAHQSELLGTERLCSYDFPARGPLAYVRVFPHACDEVISSDIFSSMMRADSLKRRYGARMEINPILFTDSPAEALGAEITRLHAGPARPSFFCLDISNHGERDHIAFPNKITAADLSAIVKEFPGCRFAIRSFACFGGGLREGFQQAMRGDADLAARLAVFVQTKPELYNRITVTSGSLYDLALVRELRDPKIPTFGAAALLADLQAKLFTELDAEAIIGGELIAQREPRRRGDLT